jgi:hypothetical protein
LKASGVSREDEEEAKAGTLRAGALGLKVECCRFTIGDIAVMIRLDLQARHRGIRRLVDDIVDSMMRCLHLH